MTKANELRLIRVYHAPAKLVWAAYTEDQHLTKWWGPRGFTITTKSKDLRPGGKWIYTMHGPDGIDYPNMTTYHVVATNQKLVYDHGGNEHQQKIFTVNVTFEEQLGKTVMDSTMIFDSPEAALAIGTHIKKVGGNSTWDRLAEYLESEQNRKDIFVINRTFKTDQKSLFAMWTSPEHLTKWMGPEGASMTYLNVAIKEGSIAHYKLTSANGESHFGKIEYKKIQPDDSLIYVQSFSDEKGNLIKPGFAPTWPDQMLTTVTFADEGPNETRVTLTWEVYGQANEIERKTFHEAKAGMTQGWTGSFDKLEELIK